MRFPVIVALSLGGLASNPSLSPAQATRTWVSGTGDDANPCSRTAPCLTFAGALTKTLAGGQINALDAGNFGSIIITKPITIDGRGTAAAISVGAVSAAIAINAAPTDLIVLRNLDVQAAVATGPTGFGIYLLRGRLIMENVRVTGFTAGVLVDATPETPSDQQVVISNSTISGGAARSANGIWLDHGVAFVSHSVITMNSGVGLFAQDAGAINADSNVLTFNGNAVRAGAGRGTPEAATVRLSNNDVYNNASGFVCNGGTIISAGNNRKASNIGGGDPVCAPNGAITQQ